MTYGRDRHTQELIDDLEHRNRMQSQQMDQVLRDAKTLSRPNQGMMDHIDELNHIINNKNKIIAEKDAEILEWMHTNAAFRKLTKDYAARLGISEEERVADVDQARVDVALDDPAFQHTQLYLKALTLVEKRKSEGTS